MSLATRFDYQVLDASTRAGARELADMVGIGRALHEAKALLGHGQFMDWLAAEFEWSGQTARNLMNVAEAFKITNFVNLKITPSALTTLAAPSVPEAFKSAPGADLDIASHGLYELAAASTLQAAREETVTLRPGFLLGADRGYFRQHPVRRPWKLRNYRRVR